MIEDKIRIGFRNITPCWDQTSFIPIIKLWQEIQQYFTNYPLSLHSWDDKPNTEQYEISLDTSNVVRFLEVGEHCETNSEEFHSMIEEGRKRGFLYYLDITMRYSKDYNVQKLSTYRMLGIFFQQLYLAMNLCVQGAGNFFNACYPNNPKPHFPPPELSNHHLENAWIEAHKWGWPKLVELSLPQTWDWLNKHVTYNLNIAKIAPQKAAFVLLEIAKSDIPFFGANEILLLSQVIEGFLVKETDNIGRLLKNRIELILGTPSSDKNWLSKFYNLRSRIIHGDYPIIRPSYYHEKDEDVNNYISEYFVPIIRSIAVVLSLMQDLIKHSSTEYEFKETIHRI